MADPVLNIPDEIQQKFPDFIALIVGSESMNDEERQYWINILPIMTPDQLTNLKDILDNEKKQLAAIDKKYSKQLSVEDQRENLQETEQKMKKQRDERTEKEQAFEQEDEQHTDALLQQISEL